MACFQPTGVSTGTKEESESAHILELGGFKKRSEQVAALRREVESWKKEKSSSRQGEGDIITGGEVDEARCLIVRLVRCLMYSHRVTRRGGGDFDKILMGDAQADAPSESPSSTSSAEAGAARFLCARCHCRARRAELCNAVIKFI